MLLLTPTSLLLATLPLVAPQRCSSTISQRCDALCLDSGFTGVAKCSSKMEGGIKSSSCTCANVAGGGNCLTFGMNCRDACVAEFGLYQYDNSGNCTAFAATCDCIQV
ncbi:hypothetical protein GQ54DRAFT_300160 [Martensiomyces pterosporus]|nr:hypothetical protein GQ54DRAFT_300160 [Martensiomyces pterosporus]